MNIVVQQRAARARDHTHHTHTHELAGSGWRTDDPKNVERAHDEQTRYLVNHAI